MNTSLIFFNKIQNTKLTVMFENDNKWGINN